MKPEAQNTKSQTNSKFKILNSKPNPFDYLGFEKLGSVSNFDIRISDFQKGFTLLEMVVAVGIFSVLIVTAIGIIVSVSGAQVKAANLQNIQDNIRFATELMTREIRVGSSHSVSSCSGNICHQINFVNPDSESIGYCIENGAIKRLSGTSICALGSSITSDNVVVERLNFLVYDTFDGIGGKQPRITISLRVRSVAGKVKVESVMNLQTTVIPRERDL